MQDIQFDEKLYNFSYPPPVLATSTEVVADRDEALPTPYIQLRARLAQALINHWTIILILVLVRLSFAARNLDRNLDAGLEQLNVACLQVQAAASNAVSMPHYMAIGANTMIAKAVVEAVEASSIVIQALLTAVEALILFFIDAFKSTYLCLLNLAITGTVDAVVEAIEDVTSVVNATLATIITDLNDGVTDANAALVEVTSIVKKAAAALGLTLTVPTLKLPAITELSQVSIPSSFNNELETIKSKINLDAVKNATDAVIEYPFDKLKVLVNSSFAGFTFNHSVLSVPPKEAALDFCTDGALEQSFDGVRHAVFVSYHILLALLIIAAVAAIIPHAYLEWWQWRSLKLNSSIAGASMKVIGSKDPTDTLLVASHPVKSFIGIKASTFFVSQRSKNAARWYVSLITHPPALLLLFLGLAGLLACLLQFIMLSSLQSATPAIGRGVTDISALVRGKLEDSSALWALETNAKINSTQTNLNTELFSWVLTSTTAVNDTLTTFTDTLVDTLNSTFGGTVLYDPILSVLDCILLLKLAGIEKGLTWVHDQAHITLPTVPTNVLAISKTDSDALFSDAATATTSDVLGFINSVIKVWRASIRQEALLASSFLLIWLVIALLGLLYCLRGLRQPPTKTAFTSCFLDDVKACISRPKVVDEATPLPTLDQAWGIRIATPLPSHLRQPSLESITESAFEGSSSSGKEIIKAGHYVPEKLVDRNVILVKDPHQSSHGILG